MRKQFDEGLELIFAFSWKTVYGFIVKGRKSESHVSDIKLTAEAVNHFISIAWDHSIGNLVLGGNFSQSLMQTWKFHSKIPQVQPRTPLKCLLHQIMVGYLISYILHVEHITSELLKYTLHFRWNLRVLIYKILFIVLILFIKSYFICDFDSANELSLAA